MKRRMLTLLWAASLLLGCTGCSLLHREWYEVTTHSSGYYEGRDALRADTYQDLVNDILVLVGNHSEEGVIWLYYAQEGLDAHDAAERACREVENDTPMGAYAVSYIQYTVDDSARNYSAITVTIMTMPFLMSRFLCFPYVAAETADASTSEASAMPMAS